MTIQINGTSGISGVDGSAATPALQGTDSNTGISFGTDEVNINTGGTTRATVDSSGRLLVGTATSRTTAIAGSGARLQIEGLSTTADSFIGVTRNVNSAGAGGISFGKSRGTTLGSATVVQSGDTLGFVNFEGADGTNLIAGGRIAVQVDGTPGSNDMPGRLVFSTTADGSSSPTERMKINSAGVLYSAPTYSNTTADAANMFVSASGQFYRSTSSLKYKTDIETLQDSYADAILNVRPVWYRSTCDGDCPDHSYWGFIAEEVAQIDKRLVQWKTVDVIYDENGSAVETPCEPEPDGVAYERFVPHLLNLIKRQKEAIEALETRVAQLEGGTN